MAEAERLAFDLQMRALRAVHPRPLADDVVLVGIDEDTEAAFVEPVALWHRHFAAALHALARTRPAAVGVDIVLPERSFDPILPGLDLAMMRAIVDVRRATHLVYVQTVNSKGYVVPVQPNYRGVLTDANLGVDQQARDPDSVSRYFRELPYVDGSKAPTLVGQLLRGLGRPVGEGFIDYGLGIPLAYVPLHRLRTMDEAQLRQAFEGKVVLIGSLIGFTDRWPLPVKLLERDPGRSGEDGGRLDLHQPGVLIHVQALRSHLSTGLLQPLPEWLRASLCALALLAVFAHARPAAILLGALVVPALLGAVSLAMIAAAQVLLPVASVIVCFWLALAARGV